MAFWLVTVLVFLAMLSPIMWLRPSRRDRRLGLLRQHARQAGITVRLAKPPLHAPPGGLVSYRWRYPQAEPGPLFLLVRDEYASEALKPFIEGWRWRVEPLRPLSSGARQYLKQALAALPEDALVLESERVHLTLWWGESLEIEAFAVPQAALMAARDALADPRQANEPPSAPR